MKTNKITNDISWLKETDKNLLKSEKNKLKFALTGGIATGKTTVVNFLKILGAKIIDFDFLAREVVKPHGLAYNNLNKLLTAEYFDKKTGSLERKKLANLIYNNKKIKKQVEDIIHPQVWALMKIKLKEIEKEERFILIFDIPLLFEAGLNNYFENIILVYAPFKVQLARLLKRNIGLTEKEALLIINNQIAIDKKLEFSTYIIDNSKSLQETEKETLNFWRKTVEKI